MVCASCGTRNDADSDHCTNCGAIMQSGEDGAPPSEGEKAGDAGVAAGCLVLLLLVFTMPIKTARMAAFELRKIAKAGALDSEREFPHLFWCKAMLPIIATALSAIVFLGVLGVSVATQGLAGLIAGPVFAVVAAVLSDWFIMLVGEYLTIKIVSGRYYTQQIEAHGKDEH